MNATGHTGDAPAGNINVGARERWVSLAAGGALVAYGLLRSWRSLPWLLLGGAMITRGYTGHSMLSERLGRRRKLPTGRATWPGGRGVRIAEAITINRPVSEVYHAYRDTRSLPQFMKHLEVVTPLGERRSVWTARTGGPIPLRLQWEAEIVAERENEMLSWRSVPGSDIDIAGAVLFVPAPGGRGTELRTVLTYIPPGGALGLAIAGAFRAVTAQQVKNDLWRFKSAMEAGEVPTVNGQPSGRQRETVEETLRARGAREAAETERLAAERRLPSQAEGERETVEEDLCEKGLAPPEECAERPAADGDRATLAPHLPSQAEGERETVEEDLRRLESAGAGPPPPMGETEATPPAGEEGFRSAEERVREQVRHIRKEAEEPRDTLDEGLDEE